MHKIYLHTHKILTGIVDQYIELVSTLLEEFLCSSADAFQRAQVDFDGFYLSELFAIGQDFFGHLLALVDVPVCNVDIGARKAKRLGSLGTETAAGGAAGNENDSDMGVTSQRFK